jgi:hypothetical protein
MVRFLWWVGSWIFKQESVSVLNGMRIGNASPPRNLKPGKRVDRTAYRLKGRFDRLRERGINVFDLPPRKRRSVEPHNREDCGRRRGNVLLARGLNRFDNWAEKDRDDFANDQLALAGYATSMVTRGTFQRTDCDFDPQLVKECK